MKLSEMFKSLDDYKKTIEAMKIYCSDEEWEVVSHALGIGDNMADSEIVTINNKEIKIDKSIAPFIKFLNNNNIPTLACCSGLQAEHYEGFKPVSGYLAIYHNNDILSYLQKNISDEFVTIEETEVYLKPAISIHINTRDDNLLLSKWKLIKNVFYKLTI